MVIALALVVCQRQSTYYTNGSRPISTENRNDRRTSKIGAMEATLEQGLG